MALSEGVVSIGKICVVANAAKATLPKSRISAAVKHTAVTETRATKAAAAETFKSAAAKSATVKATETAATKSATVEASEPAATEAAETRRHLFASRGQKHCRHGADKCADGHSFRAGKLGHERRSYLLF